MTIPPDCNSLKRYDRLMTIQPGERNSAGDFDRIPVEQTLYLFTFLSPGSVGRCAQTCFKLFSLLTDYQYSKDFYERSAEYIEDRVSQLLVTPHFFSGLRKFPLDQIPLDLVKSLRIPETATNDELPEILMRCNTLTELDLDKCKEIGDKGIVNAARNCDKLARLVLQFCSDAGIEALAPYCTTLQDLRLHNCKVSDIGMRALAPYCVNLVRLHLQRCNITDRGMTALAPSCAQLKELHLESEYRLSNTTLLALALYCNDLRLLHLSEKFDIDEGIIALAQKCGRLTSLSLHGSFSARSLYALAPKCSELKNLCLKGRIFNDDALVSLGAHCSTLENLTLHGDFGDRGLQAFAGPHCASLQQVDLSAENCTDQSMLALAPYLSHVTHLHLPENCTDLSLQAVAEHCVKLRYLGAQFSLYLSRQGLSDFRQKRASDQLRIDDRFIFRCYS